MSAKGDNEHSIENLTNRPEKKRQKREQKNGKQSMGPSMMLSIPLRSMTLVGQTEH